MKTPLILPKKEDLATEVNCVKCGNIATKGSIKHLYCASCFKKVWDDNYPKYLKWLSKNHSEKDI